MENHPTYRIVRGERERRVYGAKRRLQRDASTLVAQHLTDVPATVPPEHRNWAYDLRRGRLSIYGSLLRVIDHLHHRGVPMETVLLIPEWIASYVRELYEGTPSAGAVKLERERTA